MSPLSSEPGIHVVAWRTGCLWRCRYRPAPSASLSPSSRPAFRDSVRQHAVETDGGEQCCDRRECLRRRFPDHDLIYHTDSTRRVIYRCRLGAGGGLGRREAFVRFHADWGWPDGMATHVDGGIWVAHWGAARLTQFLPDGRLDRAIALPVALPWHRVVNAKGEISGVRS